MTLPGRVVKVSDGDTITLLAPGNVQVKVRLEAIDAPEAGQEYGQKSKQALAALVAEKQVQANATGTDRYGRSLAWITADGVKVNQRMIADGWAWHIRRYNSDPNLAAMENEARAAKCGLWAAPNAPMPPFQGEVFCCLFPKLLALFFC